MNASQFRLRAWPLFLAIALSLAVCSPAAATELAFARSGPPGAPAKLIIQPTDEPTKRLEAWEVIEEFQVRSVAVSESHIGYPDLKHGQINHEYGVPVSAAPKRYFRKQTIASTWEAEYARALPGTLNGSMNLVIQMDDLFTETIAGSWSQQDVSQYREVVGQDIYGGNVYGPNIYTAKKSWVGTAEPAFGDVLGDRTVALPSTLTYNSGKPGSTDQVSSSNAYGTPYWRADSIGPTFWGAQWMLHSGTGVGAAFGASPPADWTETRVVFQTSGVGAYEPPKSASFNYTLELSDEDTKAHVLARFEQGKAIGNLESLSWDTERWVRYGGASVEDDDHWSSSWLYLYNESEYFQSGGYIEYQKAQIRFVVPEALRIPGVAYRARLIETFYPNNPPYDAQIVSIFEAELREGQWESPIYTATARDNGSTEVQYLSARAELIQPHKVVALATLAAGPAPAEYTVSRPTLQTQFLLPNAGGQDYAERQVLTGSTTLQQIDLADAWGSIWDFDTVSARWSILPGATASVRLWHWQDDGSPLGKWTLLAPDAELRDYFGSSTDFIFAEATTGGQATVRITIDVGGKHVHDDLVVQAESISSRLAVDANRDGMITLSPDAADATAADRPYRFWLNDDDDDGDDKRSAADDIPLPAVNNDRDSENSKVDGIRDLEDFFPLYFDIKELLAVLPPGTNGLSYYLKHEDSALGVVFTNHTRAQAFDYLRGAPLALDAGFGPALTQKAGEATVTKVTAAGVDITAASPAFFDRIGNNDGGVLLVEAGAATTKPLVLEVRKGSVVIAELKLELKIDLVETMFRYVNLRSFAHGTPVAANNQGPGYGSATPTAAPNDPFATATNRKNMVFVHGYNVNGEGARGSAATAFKRFYWSGSKAKFYAVIWRGDDGQGESIAPAGATPDYHRNVGHAWQQGPLFRDFLDTLQGDTAIMAHSLGNVVTQVALTRARDPNNAARLLLASKPATVKHYFAVDAAVPLEATSATDITSDSKSKLRHSWWTEFDSQERLWPTHWHELFAGTGDARESLTWQNVFANLEVGTNFYSSGEEVLANPVNDEMPVWEPLFLAGRHAWVAQEKLKGGNGAAIAFFRSRIGGGWVENEAWYVPRQPPIPEGVPPTRRRFASEAQDVAAPNGVPSSALPAEPFFKRFQANEDGVFYPGYQGSRLHAPIGDANADDEARKLVTVAKCLGEAIPALSFPQGSNPASAFTRAGMGGNLNLNTSDFKNGWPVSRGSNTNWKHSDCLDVSYIFHFKLYDRMKTDGSLQ